jgi:hypothetical protein
MSFCPLPDELEWSDYNEPWVEADSSRWKLMCGRWISTRLHNEMDVKEGHAHYRCDICNDTGYNRKTCSNQKCMHDNIIICKIWYDMIYCYIFFKHIKLI